MSSDEIEYYIKAGSVAKRVRENIRNSIREGMLVSDLCKKVEALIEEYGCKIAFPCNVGINEVAAHYTSPPNDPTVIPSASVVKTDLGAHFNGCIADSAFTESIVPDYNYMVAAAEEALDKALKVVGAGVKFSAVGAIVEKTANNHGCKVIRNLCGHEMNRYLLHTGRSIPNTSSFGRLGKFSAGHVYAIEPFVTTKDAAGEVVDSQQSHIYHVAKYRNPKDASARKLLEFIHQEFRGLPFSLRSLMRMFPNENVQKSLANLISSRIVKPYKVLVEKTGKPVAQAEGTIVVTAHDAFWIDR